MQCILKLTLQGRNSHFHLSNLLLKSLVILEFCLCEEQKLPLSHHWLSSHKLHLQRFLHAALFRNTASAAGTTFRQETTKRKHSAVCVMNIKKNEMSGASWKYSTIGLSWIVCGKGKISKQRLSSENPSCHLYVRVVGSVEKDRRFLKTRACAWKKGSCKQSGTWKSTIALTLTFT